MSKRSEEQKTGDSKKKKCGKFRISDTMFCLKCFTWLDQVKHNRSFLFFFFFSDPPLSPLPTSSYNSIIQMSIQNTHLCLFPHRLHGNKPVLSISGGRLTHTFPSSLRPSHLPAVCRSREESQRERKLYPSKTIE